MLPGFKKPGGDSAWKPIRPAMSTRVGMALRPLHFKQKPAKIRINGCIPEKTTQNEGKMPENDGKTPETQEKSEKRTALNVRQDYYQACVRAGDLAYRIAMETEELKGVYEEMRALNQEGAKIHAEEVLASQNKKAAESTAPEANVEAPKSVQ